jgi:elongator complex protein 3
MNKNQFQKNIIQEAIKNKVKNNKEMNRIIRKNSEKFKMPFPSKIDLLEIYRELIKKGKISSNKYLEEILMTKKMRSLSGVTEILMTKKMRSLSGVTVVAILTKPYPCPHDCAYCPTEKEIPKSYLSNEPAVMRAIICNFDPVKQIKNRLTALEKMGHPTDKIELIIIGGTFSSLPAGYQKSFIKKCFETCNGDKPSTKDLVLDKKSKTLKQAQKINEKAKHRIIGLSIETRPDYINQKEIKKMRNLGVTKIEIGVQSLSDKILNLNNRGHGIAETIQATKLLKDAGFKINYHLMPDLPSSDLKIDKEMFKKIFKDENFQPDMLKIYPCMVTKGTKIYQWYKKGKYKPYSDKTLINLLAEIKKDIPCYVRIVRVIRDIPAPSIVAGSKISNLREIVAKEMKERGWQCKCIRCREIKSFYQPKEKIKLFRQDYKASGGKEIFLSWEDLKRKKIYAFLRLRIPSQIFSGEKQVIKVLENAAIIREIHTYGVSVPVGNKIKAAPQHQGLGKKLVQEAEKIIEKEFAKKFKIKKIAVISGVGVRQYWRKFGYCLKDTYMVKKIK